MKQCLNFWVMGGDRRQAMLAQQLAQDGHTVHTFALETGSTPIPGLHPESVPDGAAQSDCIVFPMPPTSEDGFLNAPSSHSPIPVSPILDALSPTAFLCGGRIKPDFTAEAKTRNLVPHDYFAREELSVANAVPTAEGAVQLAMEHLPITIHDSRVLVIGFGRVGTITALTFRALGAHVAVAARSQEQLAWAQAMGLNGVRLDRLSRNLVRYDLILNTVPATILTKPILASLRRDCLILDLASKPGGDGVPFVRRPPSLERKAEFQLFYLPQSAPDPPKQEQSSVPNAQSPAAAPSLPLPSPWTMSLPGGKFAFASPALPPVRFFLAPRQSSSSPSPPAHGGRCSDEDSLLSGR